MAKVTTEEVKHIANLAMLKLNDEEVSKLSNELETITGFVDKLKELDVSDINPTAHVLDIKNVFRKDEVFYSYDREEMLRNAPEKTAGCISVPKVVE